MEPTHGRLRATLAAGKIAIDDKALTILSAGLTTIGHGYHIEKAISGTAKTDTELKKDLSRVNMGCRTVVDILDADLSGSCQKAYARGSGGSTWCGEWAPALLSGLADQDVVGNRSGAGADAEESIERRMPCAAPIEAEHELVQVVLKVCPSQAVVNAQAPALEV